MNFFRQVLTGLRLLLLLTAVLGIAYPVAVWGVGQAVLNRQANGSLLERDGTVTGSTLIGQSIEGDAWFLPRPSAGNYDALASGGSNAGPSDGDLLATIEARRTEVANREGVAPGAVPADAVTASGSGLEPFISPEYAQLQQERVARARGLSKAEVVDLVRASTSGRDLGFLGEPRVNVVTLNAALADQG